ncbi:cryptochrome/photolyase family protein [Paucibacter sp. JuS9]|uniref:cryptochrome/photolyase family protein n=1 Tax=Paucibacter sp. JuS9 TaxID=3228748 RepID=UPI003757C940
MAERLRRLVLVLGDQLDATASAFDDFDPCRDAVWMAEVREESTNVWSSRIRIALFLAAMRHFATTLRELGRPLHYVKLDEPGNAGSLAAELRRAVQRLRPECLVMSAPGDWRVLDALRAEAARLGLPLEVREDRHFFCTVREFAQHARGRKTLRMEHFYREQRQSHGVLMDGAVPVGGRWNLDAENREAFGPHGPGPVPAPVHFEPDAVTREVLALVAREFPDHPGELGSFTWPVTRAQALILLDRFMQHRLPDFGRWQDALWPDEPVLWHSQLSAAMNLRLLQPREVVAAAEARWRAGGVPLASAEGFIRQVLGWREFVRGVYWTRMPGLAAANALAAHEPLPAFYWTGKTDLPCLADALGQTLRTGYAHHIQRLMVTGLFGLLLGVEPAQMHAWYLAVYVDAVEWVELPNTLCMSQFADGGGITSKPYVASGRYIERMSSSRFCAQCRHAPGQRTGPAACPFTTLYWDFLQHHRERFRRHPRLGAQVRHLDRMSPADVAAVQAQAEALRARNRQAHDLAGAAGERPDTAGLFD